MKSLWDKSPGNGPDKILGRADKAMIVSRWGKEGRITEVSWKEMAFEWVSTRGSAHT